MNQEELKNIIFTLENINNEIKTKNFISVNNLESLILIIYNELILNQNTSPIIHSYISIILYNFIELKKSNIIKQEIINNIIHPNFVNNKNGTNINK